MHLTIFDYEYHRKSYFIIGTKNNGKILQKITEKSGSQRNLHIAYKT